MKTSDITPMTVLYTRQEGPSRMGRRSVVLDTATWAPKRQGVGRWGELLGFAPVTGRLAQGGHSGERGMLVLVEDHGINDVSDEEMFTLAEAALAAAHTGRVPSVHPRMTVTTVAAREITKTWEQYSTEQAAERARREAEQATKDRIQADGVAARARLADVLGEQALAPLRNLGPKGWVALEQAMSAYHSAKSAEEATMTALGVPQS